MFALGFTNYWDTAIAASGVVVPHDHDQSDPRSLPHERRECAPPDSDLQVNRQSSSAMRLAARNRPTDRECSPEAPGLQ